MRSAALVLVLLLVGIHANDNYIRVENGKVVGHGFATDLHHMPSMRAVGDGSTQDDDNVFNGVISITDALNKDSPLSQWVDDLLNPESDPYKQAVLDAMKILLVILLSALGALGINTFTILILGFSQGSVDIAYQVSLPVNNSENANSTVIADSVSNVIETSDDADLVGFTFNNTKTEVSGGDGTEITAVDCGECWSRINGQCAPNADKISLVCNANGMELTLDQCVMSNSDFASLHLDDGSCDSSTNIAQSGSDFVVTTSLDACSTEMAFGDDTVSFRNHLRGAFGSGALSSYDEYSIEFMCDYATKYDDISADTEVQPSVQSGPTDGTGSLSFSIVTFTDDSFNTVDDSGSVRVGTTLNFGIQISQEIAGVEFSVTSCEVKNSDQSLDYAIMMSDRCPNAFVNFILNQNSASSIVTASYTVFEFKNDAASQLHLSCNIVVCDASDGDSSCAAAPDCNGRRKRRSLNTGLTYFRVARDLVTV